MLFKKNDSVLFLGDSITSASKPKEEGEGAPSNIPSPFGEGFVNLVYGYLHLNYPELHLRVINKGISGNRSIDLVNRFQSDCIDYKPNWLILMVGTNDIWRQFDCPDMPKYNIGNQEYESNIEYMVKRSSESNTQVIICSPFIIEPNKKELMRTVFDVYGAICKNIAEKYNAIYIDIQKAFDRLLKNISTYELAKDRIHPNITGHMLIMQEIMRVVERN